MRILYLSQLVPYPVDAGPKVRSYNVLQYLATAGHRVTLLAFQREGDSPEALRHLHEYCETVNVVPIRRSRVGDVWHLTRAMLSGQPFLIKRDGVGTMYDAIQACMKNQEFDAVHADQLWMAQYALAARDSLRNGATTRLILDQHNAMYLIPQRLASGTTSRMKRALLRIESRNMSRYEAKVCSQFDHVVWVSEEDREAVAQLATADGQAAASASQHTVIPICVDPAVKQIIPPAPRRRRVTFLGGLHWPPNEEGVIWFAREVWPTVARLVPDAVFTVIGKNPPPALSQFKRTNGHKRIDVTGYVDDPEPYLSETAAFVVPLHAGGGMRVKIIDAWSWGLPVVSTTIGAEGIAYQAESNLLIADDAHAFGAAVTRLLQDEELAVQLGVAGRKTVEQSYDWRRVYQAWDDVYRQDGTQT